MPGTRREAGFIALIGLVVALIGPAARPEQPGALLLVGAVVFIVGAVLWLIHYSADLRKEQPKS